MKTTAYALTPSKQSVKALMTSSNAKNRHRYPAKSTFEITKV